MTQDEFSLLEAGDEVVDVIQSYDQKGVIIGLIVWDSEVFVRGYTRYDELYLGDVIGVIYDVSWIGGA